MQKIKTRLGAGLLLTVGRGDGAGYRGATPA